MAKVLGYVNLHSDVSLDGLTERRPVASVSFLGRYGVIDFVLSNFSNSGVETVGILIKEKPRSLIKHMAGGTAWNFNSKKGGISLLYDEKFAGNNLYNNDVNNIVENVELLNRTDPDYVIVAPAHFITTMDFNDLLEAHAASGNDVTMAFVRSRNANEEFIGADMITIDKESKLVTKVTKNMGTAKTRDISLETYVFSKTTFQRLLKDAQKKSAFFSIRDMLATSTDEVKIGAYQFRGFAKAILSIEDYLNLSLSFLKMEVNTQVFKSNWPIYTNTNDTPPAKYLENAQVKNTMVANGVVVDGTVENSILARDVKIGKGAVVKNSVILSGTVVKDGARVENAVIDKNATIKADKEVVGVDGVQYVREGDII